MELHERAVAAINAGQVPEEILASDFCMENRVTAVTDYEYHGASGWRDWMNDLFEVFAEGASYEVQEIIAVGEDYIAAMFCMTGLGAQSALPLEFRWAGVTWFDNGKATRAVGYRDRDHALRAAGVAA